MAGNRNEEMVYCSFCGKNQEEVKKIIAGNGVFICNECVALSQEIIREEMAEEVLADLAETPKPKELLDILNNYVVRRPRSRCPCPSTTTINVSTSQKVVKTMMWICKNQIFS